MSKQVWVSNPPWLEVRCSEPVPFYFARRKGKDSIAVLLHRKVDDSFVYDLEYLIRMQPLVHVDDGDSTELFACPVTGGMEEGEAPEICALREIYEETGYKLGVSQLTSLGSYIASTQTDEVVYCFTADVTNVVPDKAVQDGTFHESISKNVWLTEAKLEEIFDSESQPVYSGLFYCWAQIDV